MKLSNVSENLKNSESLCPNCKLLSQRLKDYTTTFSVKQPLQTFGISHPQSDKLKSTKSKKFYKSTLM